MIQLLFGDCLEQLNNIADNSIDMVFADMPYGTTQNAWDTPIPLNDYVRVNYNMFSFDEYLHYAYQQCIPYMDAIEFFQAHHVKGLWYQLERIISDNGVIALWCQSPFDKELAQSNRRLYRYEWIIEKTKGTGHLNARKMPMKCHENVLIFYKSLPVYNPQMTDGHPPVHNFTRHTDNGSNYGKGQLGISGGGSTTRYPRDIISFKWDTQKSKLHPTQKPLEACKYFIMTYTNPGDTVLDFCMGSNTTGLASKELQRNYIGIESDEHYFKIATERINSSI